VASRLCPQCRALIDARASDCPYCGANVGLARAANAGSGFTSSLLPSGRLGIALLLLVNCALYVGILVSGSTQLANAGAKNTFRILNGEWYRLITAGYLHVWFLHIFMNMMGLFNLGPIVEEIYTVATITGFVASAMWQPGVSSLGASAGLFGLLGALIAYGLVSKSFVAKHLQQQCIVNAAAGFLMGAFMPMIDNAAHAGGLIGGFAIAYFAGVPRWVDDAKEKLWTVAALVCLLLTLYAFYEMTTHLSAMRAR
jgi:rhomboid protease GluP